jgi:HlyD family secretion protein
MKKNYSKYVLWSITILIVLVMLVLALSKKGVPVMTAHVVTGTLVETITAEGTTRYHDTYLISAPIAGLLTRTAFEVGARLHQGEVLANILPPVLDPRQVEELQARLEGAHALEEEANNHVAEAKTTLEQARREMVRMTALASQNAATHDQLEHDSDAVEQGKQDVQAAEARVRSAHHDAEAIRASLTNTAGGTHIPLVSPVNGVLLEIYEKNSRAVAASAPIFNIGDTTREEVVIDLLSSDAPRVHLGDSVLVAVPGIDHGLHATIRLIEPDAYIKISPLGIEEKRVNVIAALHDRAPELGSTYRVDATMVLWTGANVLKVPISALFRNGKDWSVWITRDGKSKEQRVTLGHMSDTEAEVLSGLKSGDEVIVHPSNEVIEGAKVSVTTNSSAQ